MYFSKASLQLRALKKWVLLGLNLFLFYFFNKAENEIRYIIHVSNFMFVHTSVAYLSIEKQLVPANLVKFFYSLVELEILNALLTS